MKILFLLFATLVISYPFSSTADKFKDGITYEDMKAIAKDLKLFIKSCSGCKLASLTEIRDFIRHDVSYYPIEMIYSHGDPRLLFINNQGEIYFSKYLAQMTRQNIYDLLRDLEIRKYN